MRITDDILRAERELRLNQIEDSQGIKVWETMRYAVNTQLLRHSRPIDTHSRNEYNSSIYFTVKRIWRFLIYTLTHLRCRSLLIMNSRASTDGQYCDIIADSLYEIANKSDLFIIETSNNWVQPNYKYGRVCPSIMTLLFRINKSKYDYSKIVSAIKQPFRDVEIDEKECSYYYKLFYTQCSFYKKFLKLMRFNRIIFVQNGIYKGLLAAAKKNDIITIELQHGQISRNHFAYSYPQDIYYHKEDVYNPDYLLTFGPLWLKDAIFPGVQIVPLGNNFYGKTMVETGKEDKNVLVISSIIHADKLKELVRDISSKDASFHFYYKLHPDEFNLHLNYVQFFASQPNVEVIKNEQTISELLAKTEVTLVVQSTAMVEALNAGRQVFVFRTMDYEVMDFLYGEKGINFIDDAQSFLVKYSDMSKDSLPKGKYFMPFNEEIGKQMMTI